MMDHSRFVIGCLLLIIPVVKSNHSPVRALIGSNVTLEWTEVQGIYNQPEYINTSILWYQIKGSHSDFYMILKPNGDLVPNKALGLNNGSHRVLLLDESRQRVGFVIYAVRQDDEAKYRLRENRTIELLVYAVSDLRVTVKTPNVTAIVELENAYPLNLHTEQTNLTITLNLEKTAPDSAKVTSTRIFKNGSRETTDLQCTQGGGRWLNRICPIQMNLSRGDYDTTELTLDYLVEGTKPIILMVVTTPAAESGKQVAIGVSVAVCLAVIAVIIGVILYIKKNEVCQKTSGKGQNKSSSMPMKVFRKSTGHETESSAVIEDGGEAQTVNMTIEIPPEAHPESTDEQEPLLGHATDTTKQASETSLSAGSGDGREATSVKTTCETPSTHEHDPVFTSVPPHDLNHIEYRHQIDGEKDQCKKQIHTLNGCISAYINTCGGCVQLSAYHTLKTKFNSWKGDIRNQLNSFLPEHLLEYITFDYNNGIPFVHINPSPDCYNIVSLNTHLYTRKDASKWYEGKQHGVTSCMNQVKETHTELATKSAYTYNEQISLHLRDAETNHIEYKYFDGECSAAKLLAIINGGDDIAFSFFGMANLPGGGTIVMGVDGERKVIGQPLSKSEEEEFREGLLKFYREDLNGKKRYCNDQEFVPVKGKHFRVDFIPVEVSDKSKIHCVKEGCNECPNKRRVLIKISIFQIEGILLMQCPESYKVSDNGQIVRLSIDEWYKAHKKATPATPHHQKAGDKMEPSDSTVKSKGDSSYPKDSQRNLSQRAPQSDSRRHEESPGHDEKHAYKYTGLSFKHNSSQCNPGPAEAITPESIVEGAKYCEILKLRQPCNFHPSCDALLLQYPSIKEKLDVIKKKIGDEGSFALADSSLFSCFTHDLKASDLPPGSPLKSPGIKPSHHLIDIFAVDESRTKNIFCLFEGDGTHHDQEKSYGLQLARVLKKRLTEVLKEQGKGSEVRIKLTILRMESDEPQEFQFSHLSEDDLPDYVEMEMMKVAVASTFLVKESVFKDKMGKDITIQFSLEQSGLLRGSNDWYPPVTIITGSPGTGKTLIAQCLCEKFGKKDSIYLCSTKPLEQFVKFVGKAETFLLTPDTNLYDIIQDYLRSGKYYIVIDETHMIECEVVIWKKIFDKFRTNSANKPHRLFIFRDSQYHDYQNVQASSQLTTAIKSYKKEHRSGVIHKTELTANFRNSQVVGSYMHAIQPEHQAHIKFKGTTVGDDITVLVVRNLRVKSDENGLLLRVKEKTKTTDPREIAILVGWSTKENVQEDLDLFSSVFTEYKIKFQRADQFPPDGIVLDSVWNFTGLDRDVIMHITPADKDAREKMLQNNKYMTAVASRGINRVELLQDEVVDHQQALEMNFDEPPTDGDTVIKKQSSSPSSTSKESEGAKAPSSSEESEEASSSDESEETDDEQVADDLCHAAAAGDVNRVSALLEQGADINAEDWTDLTALTQAAQYSKLEVVKLLLSLGADTERGLLKPLTLAAANGRIDIIQCLLQHGADINAGDGGTYSPLGKAAVTGKLEVVKLLISRGADTDWGLLNPLYLAAYYGHIDIIHLLLQHGADINGVSGDGLTALWRAAGSGQLEVVKLLLSLEADTERGKEKPLSEAARYGHIDTVQCLLQHGADINGVSEGATALWRAAGSGNLELLKLLLSKEAGTEQGQWKPLSLAAGNGRIDTVQCLLQHGASQEAKNQALTAALKAVQEAPSWFTDTQKANLKPIVEILRSNGAVTDGEQ